MADSIDVDFSELLVLTADLGHAPAAAGLKIHQAIEVTARNIKTDWAKKLEGTPDVPHGSRTIGYDINATAGDSLSTISAEIGAEDGKSQAPIVAVLEFGAPGNNLQPHGYGAAALQENEADFLHGLELATEPLA